MRQKISNPKSEKQDDIYKLLDNVVKTGVPVEFKRKGKRLVIGPAEKKRNLDKLESHPEFIKGDPDDLIHMDWSSKWEPEI